MSSHSRKDWINVLDTGQSAFASSFRSYECPKYMFEEEYDRQKVKEDILKSHRIKDAIEKHSCETGCGTSAAAEEASNIIDEISHAFTIKMVRFLSTVLMKLFRTIFNQVLVNRDGIEAFREAAKVSPIVLVPTHNSYFDFLLASAICFWVDLPLPAIVAGQDFLHIVIVNHILRRGGALYMRRSFASDSFYRSIFTEYVQRILSSGNRPIEFFVEGTRSRCGKALQPKLGLLAMILESFFHGFVQDVTFIPISISYEKATEEYLYLYELLGIPKPKESLSGLLKSRSILSTDFGTVSFHFGKPMSLREYCYAMVDSTEYVNIPRCERHLRVFGRGVQEMEIAKYFGMKVVHAQQCNSTIYPRAVLASLVLATPHASFGLEELSYSVDSIGRLLVALGCNTSGFEDILINKDSIKNTIKYCDYVLKLDSSDKLSYISPVVEDSIRNTDLMKTTGDNEFLSRALGYVYLSCQRNKLIHCCLLPSIFLHSVKSSTIIEETRKSFEFTCKLFSMEFIFDPDCSLEKMFDLTCKKLQDLSMITTTTDGNIVVCEVKCKENIDFLISLLQPFYDAYMVVVLLLLTCAYDFPLTFKSISSSLQLQAANIIKPTGMTTYESLSLHTLSNVITSFCKSRLLKTVKNDKFETLVDGVDMGMLEKMKKSLLSFVCPELRIHLNKPKL